MVLINLHIIMITSLSDEVGRVHRRGQIRDFEVAYHKLNEFVDVTSVSIRKSMIKFLIVYS